MPVQPTPWTPQATPPGWHPDPTRRFEFRYWNGERWTADVSTHGQRFVDPQAVTFAPVANTAFAPVVASPRSNRGMAVASFVIAAVSLLVSWVPFIFVLGAAGAIVAFVFGLMALGRVRRNEGEGKALAVWGIVLSIVAAGLCVVGAWLSVEVVREVRNYLDPGPYETTILSCTTVDGLVTFDGTILNQDDVSHDYTVHVRYADGETFLDSDSASVRRVAPLELGRIHSTVFVDRSITDVTCSIDGVDGFTP